jgi:hypothetical protein
VLPHPEGAPWYKGLDLSIKCQAKNVFLKAKGLDGLGRDKDDDAFENGCYSGGVTTNNLGFFRNKLLQVCLVDRHLIKVFAPSTNIQWFKSLLVG